VEDPYVIARALGAAVPLGVIAFVATRKLCGPSGSAELERLKRIAGVGESEPRAKLMLRDWLPFGAGALAVVLGFGVAFIMGGGLKRPFSAADLPKLRAGFVDGCIKECGARMDPTWCSGFCNCTFTELRTSHASDDAFARWFPSVGQVRERIRRDVLAAQTVCAQRLPPP